MELTIIVNLGEKVGAPTTLQGPLGSGMSVSSASGTPAPAPAEQAPTPAPQPHTSASAMYVSTSSPQRHVYPIEGLCPYQNNWTIRVKVKQKSDIRTYSNTCGDGKLFSATLMDETGEIKATAFNNNADEFFPKLQEGKTYYISKGQVNLANTKYATVNNEYELGLQRGTIIEEVNLALSTCCGYFLKP